MPPAPAKCGEEKNMNEKVETVKCYNASQHIVGEVDVLVKRIGNKVWSAHTVAQRLFDSAYTLPQRFDWYDQQNVGEIGWEGNQEEWAAKPLRNFSPGINRCRID